MSAQAQILGGEAPPHTLTHRGKTYTLRPIDDAMNVEWERRQLARDREFERGNRDAGLLTDAQFGERLDRLSERYRAGHYSLYRWLLVNGEALQRAAGDPAAGKELIDGFVLLNALVFGCDRSEMLRLLAERGQEVVSLFKLIVSESMPVGGAAGGGDAPNA